MNSKIPVFDPLSIRPAVVDSFHRQVSYVRLSVTDLCNFRCVYCLPDGYQGKKQPSELGVDEIAQLATALGQLGVRKIRLTGGEPGLRPDLPEIIRTVRHTPGIEQVALTTNGYRLDRFFPDWAKAGLDSLNLSVDSFKAAEFARITGMDMLPEILSNVEAILAAGFTRIKLNAVLMRSTFPGVLADALDYIRQRPVTFRFIEMMQTGQHHALFATEHLDYSVLLETLARQGFTPLARGLHDGPAVEYAHPDYAGKIGLIAPYRPGFCESCNRVRISSMGQVHLCLYDQQAYDLRPLLQGDQPDRLNRYLSGLIHHVKPEGHRLKEGDSGLIANLSQIGG